MSELSELLTDAQQSARDLAYTLESAVEMADQADSFDRDSVISELEDISADLDSAKDEFATGSTSAEDVQGCYDEGAYSIQRLIERIDSVVSGLQGF